MEHFTCAGKTHGNEIGDNRRLFILAETASSAPGPRSERALLAECHRQQARAEQHEAGRRQGKKSVGDNVVVAHETPTTPDVRPNLLKLSESRVEIVRPYIRSPGGPPEPPDVYDSGPVTIAFKCMSQENACAHQAHHRCNRLDHRTSPYAPLHAQNDSTLAQSKRFTGRIVERS